VLDQIDHIQLFSPRSTLVSYRIKWWRPVG